MANEAVVVSSLTIAKDNLRVKSFPDTFRTTVLGAKGPCPGAFTASTEGTIVDLSQLANPGLYVIRNLDLVNFVELGIWDGFEFYPLNEIQAGEMYAGRFSRNLSQSYIGTGPGTNPDGTVSIMVRANGDNCDVSIEGYEA